MNVQHTDIIELFRAKNQHDRFSLDLDKEDYFNIFEVMLSEIDERTYDDGYEDGRESGYGDGHDSGKEDGESEGEEYGRKQTINSIIGMLEKMKGR